MDKLPENKELNALINLLDEPDDSVYSVIVEKIFTFGTEAIPVLEHSWENSFNILVQERIENIIRKIHLDNLQFEFANWVGLGSSDLLKGFIIVTKTQYPDINEEKLIIQVEQIKMDIWLELNDNMTALENVKVLNHVFFGVQRFDGNKINPSTPQNFYLNTLLETKKGSPLTLGILYIILARKLKIPIYGVNLPQHFILAYLMDNGIEDPSDADVLFYINPFNKGSVFTRREIELFVRQLKVQADRSFYEPCSNIDIIKRLISGLIFSYQQLGYPEKIDDLENLLRIIESG
ncbi:MAG: transglutaminase-like domain-containing protein [Bacteroidetes bacterium]|nr:transglutaminase-like domain-containing protein [Bacteroidota bacterium]